MKFVNEFKWLWQTMGQERKHLLISITLSVFTSALTIVNPHISRLIVDQFISNPNAAENVINKRNTLIFLLVFMVIFTLIRTGLAFFTTMSYEKTSKNTARKVRTEMYEHIQRQDKDYYRSHNIGDLMTRMTGDLDMIRHSLAWVIKSIVESSVIFLVTLIYLSTINFQLTLSLLILAPLIFWVANRFSKDVRPKYIKLRETLSELNSLAQQNIAANKIVKSFTREEYEIEKFNKGSKDYKNANQTAALTRIKYLPLLEVLANSFNFLLLLIGGFQIIRGNLSYGEFAAFSALIWAISNPMRNIGMVINDMERFFASVVKIRELYYSQSTIVKDEYVKDPIELEGRVLFDNVSLQIDNDRILSHVTFEVKPGEFVAIMGPTGSGKTKILDLIARLDDPTKGRVLVDGKDIRQYSLDEYRANVAVATQDVILFSDTIEDNIAYGDSQMGKEKVVGAAKDAAAHDFILETSDQYKTLVGEFGIGLSGGQRQRLSLARALASQRSILLLDDITSAVDNETEQEIIDLLLADKYTSTKVVVAQRISTAKHADRIYVLDKGQIVEAGTHKELMDHNGFYAELVEIQESYEKERDEYE